MLGGMLASAMNRRVSFSGALTTTSASSPVTSATRNIVGSGVITFYTIGGTSGATPEYQLNGGSWATITEGMNLAVAHGGTLAVRATILAAPQTCTFFVRKKSSNALIESVTLTRS